MKKLYCFFIGLIYLTLPAQTGINTITPHPSSLLDISSTNKGILIPKVPITSKADNTTIQNPAKGLLIIAGATSGTGNSKVYEDRLYTFNGVYWDEILENNTNAKNFLYPRLAAAGRKTTETNCTDLRFGNFELDIIKNKDGNILNNDGSLKASRKGYYSWSIQLVQKMLKNAYNPYFTPGYISYEFRSGSTTTRENQYLTYSGTVYLDEGETSEPFRWYLGDSNNASDKCSSEDLIGGQVVIWKYLGE